MEAFNGVVQAISSVGFPIICTLLLAYIIYDMNNKSDAKMQEFIRSIDANTKAISELYTFIHDMERGKDEPKA